MRIFSRRFSWCIAFSVLSWVQGFCSPHFQNGDFRKALLAGKDNSLLVSMPTAISGSAPALKKPVIGAVLSAAVPGAGEFYAGSWLKGTLFLGAEIALWVGYKHFSDDGKEWDQRFTAYADAHWSEPKYWVFMAGPGQANVANVSEINYTQYLEQLRAYEREHYSHSLHLEKDQQYYEMIGKYDQFHAGWDDFAEGQPTLTPHRDEYDEMRYKSNTAFKNASACAMAVLTNHVLSSFDAVWTVSKSNRRLSANLRTGWMPLDGRGTPVLTFAVRW